MMAKNLKEFDYYIDPLGNKFNLHDAEVMFVLSTTGRGMPPIEYITERGPLQHGESLLDYRLRPRVIARVIRRRFPSRQDYWDGRNDLLDALRPNRQVIGQFNPGTLRKILPNGTMRDIKVIIESGPAFEPRSVDQWDEWAFTEALRFVAHDPTFYDPVTQSVVWILVTEDELVFPIVFPIWFSGAIIISTINIAYQGDWLAYPTIVITGPTDNPLIENLTTGEKLQLDGYSIVEGEIVSFITEYGQKSVTNNLGDNLLPYLTADSDLATFHLEPGPGAAGGVNQVRVQAPNATPATHIAIYWNCRFIGI